MTEQTSDSPIIFSYELKSDGKGIALDESQTVEKLKSKALAWVHLDANHPDTRGWLEKNVGYLDNIILDALLAKETRPRMAEIGDGALIFLRGINFNENAAPEDMISLRMWVDGERIITMRMRKLRAVLDMEQRLREGNGPKNIGDFVTDLSANLFQKMEPVVLELDDISDDLEERILEDPQPKERKQIIDLRKKVIVFRRYIAPQREVMSTLRATPYSWLDDKHRRKLLENQERVTRYVEELDAIRERAQIIKDELGNILSDRMNKNMYVLSIVAAVFLPLGFLTGLLGINVGGMPGADDNMAFWVVCGLCLAFSVLILFVFKKLKWI